ncbi:response regulator [Lujinxingia vulgaris]|uniref:histidine kinase n=1 Tax=Lujinxingia vulgaris TaxID=2600176 RepID=A0A5C6XAS1_9DELT|nr:ATP-binding protein [Lujinxingia vulgaris]TXD34387.1 response regulator [Lujinxingia vulgaris]
MPRPCAPPTDAPRIPLLFSPPVNFFTPPELREARSYEAYKHRVAALLGLGLWIWAPVFALMYITIFDSFMLFAELMAAGVIGLMAIWRMRKTGDEVWLAHQTCAVLSVVLIVLTLHTGGIYSPVLFWLLLVPVVSITMAGPSKALWFWMAVALAVMAYFYVEPIPEIDLRTVVTINNHRSMLTVSMVGLLLATLMMFWARYQIERWLMERNNESQRRLQELHEETKRVARDTLLEIMERTPQGVVLLNADGNAIYGNASFKELGCYDDESLRSLHATTLFTNPEGEPLQSLLNGQSQNILAMLHTASDEQLAIRLSIFTAIFENQDVHALLITDLSQEHELQSRIAQMDRMITAGTLAAGVAHEINNPLAYVASNVEYLLEKIADDAIDRDTLLASLEDVHYGTRRVRKIVDDLRDLSRTPTDDIYPVDVATVLDSTLLMVEHRVRQRAQLIRDIDDLPSAMLNESGLSQVLLNLLVNAVQAIEPGTPEKNHVRVSARRADNHLIIEVSDSGHGIAPEQLEHIFEPFFTTKPIGEGTGLGLSICRKIVAEMNGDIDVESTPGQGTTFRLIIPTRWLSTVTITTPPPGALHAPPRTRTPVPTPPGGVRDDRAPAEQNPTAPSNPSADANASPAPAQPDADTTSPAPTGVFLIDDNAMLLRALKRQLQSRFTLHTFESASDALDAIEAGAQPCLIVCDLEMPAIGGARLYQRLSEAHPALARRMIFMTGGAYSAESKDFLESGDFTVLAKPFPSTELESLISRATATS